MKSIQTIAIVLWMIIFVVAAFILGQFLMARDIFDITKLFTLNEAKDTVTNEEQFEDDLENEIVINKFGQETVRIGQNIANDYFSEYYKAFVSYIMADEEKYKANDKVAITDDLASDYVFYALAGKLDESKYISEENDGKILISEGDLNSFIDKMFAKEISETYKGSDKGYDSTTKTYMFAKNERQLEYTQELINIGNITSNEVKLEFDCVKVINGREETQVRKQVNIYAVYIGGRYIVTAVEKIEK